MHLIWHGTASVEIVSGPDRILFDPFVTLPGAEIKTEIGEFDGFPEIFVTHGHFDHIASLPEIVRRNPEVRIYCTSVPLATLVRKGVDRNNLRELAFGQEIRTGGFEILPMHGKHARLPRPDMGRLSYVLKSPARGNIPRILKDHPAAETPEGGTGPFRRCFPACYHAPGSRSPAGKVQGQSQGHEEGGSGGSVDKEAEREISGSKYALLMAEESRRFS